MKEIITETTTGYVNHANGRIPIKIKTIKKPNKTGGYDTTVQVPKIQLAAKKEEK